MIFLNRKKTYATIIEYYRLFSIQNCAFFDILNFNYSNMILSLFSIINVRDNAQELIHK